MPFLVTRFDALCTFLCDVSMQTKKTMFLQDVCDFTNLNLLSAVKAMILQQVTQMTMLVLYH